MNKRFYKISIVIWGVVLLLSAGLFTVFAVSSLRQAPLSATSTAVSGAGGDTKAGGGQERATGGFDMSFGGQLQVRKEEAVDGTIDSLGVDWVSGTVRIEKSEDEKVHITQWADGDFKESHLYKATVLGGKLSVRDGRMGLNALNFGFNNTGRTAVEIRLPEKAYKELGVSTVSGDIATSALEAESFSCDTVSGDTRVAGGFDTVRLETVSGDCRLELNRAAEKINADGVSGDIFLYLPQEGGFTLDFDKVSGDLECSLPLSRQNGRYIYQEGGTDISVNTVSGDLEIDAR